MIVDLLKDSCLKAIMATTKNMNIYNIGKSPI